MYYTPVIVYNYNMYLRAIFLSWSKIYRQQCYLSCIFV